MDNKKDLLVSIITPTLNQVSTIEQTILSVLKQSYSNIEYIIMDGGSTDGTLELLKNYASDRRLKWFSSKDEGQYDAINKGFLIAKGDILGWINSDDTYAEDAIEKIVKIFMSNSKIDVVYGLYRISYINKSNYYRIAYPVKQFSLKWLKRYCFINPSVTFVKRSIIHVDKILIDNSIKNFGDWDWFLRIGYARKTFCFLPEILGDFRFHGSSKIMTMDKKQIKSERKIISMRHDIPLNYIYWWHIIIIWMQRFHYSVLLINQRNFGEICQRILAYPKRFIKYITKGQKFTPGDTLK